MTFDGNDYTVVGLGLEFVGGYLLARSTLKVMDSDPALATWATEVRLRTYSHWEACFGFACFLSGLFLALVGTIRSTYAAQGAFLRDVLWPFLFCVALGAAALVWALSFVADRIAKHQYPARVRESQRWLLHQAIFALANDGRFPNDPPNVTLTPAARQERMAMVTTGLDSIAKVFEEARTEGETDAALLERLRKRHFS